MKLYPQWVLEGPGRAYIQEGALYLDSRDTWGHVLWFRPTIIGDFTLQFKLCILGEGKQEGHAFIVFFDAQEADGGELRLKERDGHYPEYHRICNYSVSFHRGRPPWVSILRKNPGFRMLTKSREIHPRLRRDYHLCIEKYGSRIRFLVDDEVLIDYDDHERPYNEGKIGLRSFNLFCRVSDIRLQCQSMKEA
ncbi:hypothetical protein DRO64_09095 [Candidatus Bathyarchaeota archaeon]|nr:MAG: hypothetical protein DRO64_09095 [Candidatus Bathyarchaeota archaeon]